MNKTISFGAFPRSHLETLNDYLLESKNTSRNWECKIEESTVLTGYFDALMQRHLSLWRKKLQINGITVFVNGNQDPEITIAVPICCECCLDEAVNTRFAILSYVLR